MRALRWILLVSAGVAWGAQAQQPCPALPADTPLHWEQQASAAFTVCRALNAEGEQVFGVMLTERPTITPRRRNREEEARIGAYEMYWYKPDLAVATSEEKRVTVIELGKGRYAQIWVDAPDAGALQHALGLAQSMALN